VSRQGPGGDAEQHGSAIACILLGLIALAIGLYFVINPTVSGVYIANLIRASPERKAWHPSA